jgi:DNA-binding transcriptional ArsR family regulator
MGNDVFRALGSQTRVSILKLLAGGELHVSEVARRLDLSVPVVARHVKVLEEAGLVRKRVVGNLYLLSSVGINIEEALAPLRDKAVVTIKKKESLFDALRQVPGVEITSVGDSQYITSINGERGYFIYEVDGKAPSVPIDQYHPAKTIRLQVKKLVPVSKKMIHVRIK